MTSMWYEKPLNCILVCSYSPSSGNIFNSRNIFNFGFCTISLDSIPPCGSARSFRALQVLLLTVLGSFIGDNGQTKRSIGKGKCRDLFCTPAVASAIPVSGRKTGSLLLGLESAIITTTPSGGVTERGHFTYAGHSAGTLLKLYRSYS